MTVQVVEARSTVDLMEICKDLDSDNYDIKSVVPTPYGFIIVAQKFEYFEVKEENNDDS